MLSQTLGDTKSDLILHEITGNSPEYSEFTFPRLSKHLSDDSDAWIRIGLRCQDRAVGLILGSCDLDSSLGWLMSLRIHPDFRRQGGATKLVAGLQAAMRARGKTSLKTRLVSEETGTAPMIALLGKAGWSSPAVVEVNLMGEAGTMSDDGKTWPSVERLLTKPSAYDFDSWDSVSSADIDAIARLKQQPACTPDFHFDPVQAQIDPACSLLIRRAGQVVGWIAAIPLQGALTARFPDRVHRHYYSAYIDMSLWSSGLLIAGYCVAFQRQAATYGKLSVAMYFTHMPRMMALTRRRFHAMALRYREIFELQTSLPATDGTLE